MFMPVTESPCGPQRRPAVTHRPKHRIATAYVEIGILLPGERQIRQVFRIGRGTHRNRWLTPTEGGIGLRDLRLQRITQIALGKQRLDTLRGGIERHRCAHEFRFCPIDDGLLKIVVRNELPVGGCRHRKTGRDWKSGSGHACQRLAFAADRNQIGSKCVVLNCKGEDMGATHSVSLRIGGVLKL